jgi:hypothetical protein
VIQNPPKEKSWLRACRDGVLEDCPRPRGQLEDKIWRPWPRTSLALALASNQHGLGLDVVLLRLGILVSVAGNGPSCHPDHC